MVNILSTIELTSDMVAKLEAMDGVEYRFKRSHNLTTEDREWAEVLNTYGSHMNAYNLEAFTALRWMNVMSAGVDSLPFEQLNGVLVTNARGIHKIQMTEYTVGLILNYYKNFYQTRVDQENRVWNRKNYTEEIYGKTAHIFGTGSIGAHIAKVLQVFGVHTVGYNTSGRDVQHFDATHNIENRMSIISEADIVISILPATDSTDKIFDYAFFEAMKEEAVFINIGRGNVVSDEVLIRVLDEKPIAHLILDVFNNEPLDESSKFYNYDNITITPHSSAKTDKYLERAFEIFTHNIEKLDTPDEMKNVIDPSKGY